jgi:putative spermidine/putrescine transport system substrate-binding protein
LRQSKKNIERRKVLKGLSLGVTSAMAAPYVHTQDRPALRVLGAHQTLYEPIRLKAEQDLGFSIEYIIGEHAAVTHRAATQPQSFDLFEKSADYVEVLWNSGAIQPIEKRRIHQWDSIGSLAKTGRVIPDTPIAAGSAPYKILNVIPDTRGNGLGERSTDLVSFLPYVHNVDAFGYLADRPGNNEHGSESWSWLLDDQYHGKVGILIDPAVGFNELAMAAQASGLAHFEDLGNMTHDEIGQFINVLIDIKKSGHFAGFWHTLPQSIDFVRSGRTRIQSMFSPAFYRLKSLGYNVVYAQPREGCRAWQGVMCLSSAVENSAKDMAYEYMNWWLSGWAGAYIARQGYYISNPESVRAYLSKAEWGYWYGGKPAETDLPGIDGNTVVRQGEIRPGGSYLERLSHIKIWNGITHNYEYKLSGWNDFLIA